MSTKRDKVVLRGGILTSVLSGTMDSIVFQRNGRMRISGSRKRRGYVKINKVSHDSAQKNS